MLAPRSVEPPSSARAKIGGLCEAIRIVPPNIRGIIRLDDMAPINTAATYINDTNTERIHRKNRDLWTEIEYLIHMRLATRIWPHLSTSDLHAQLIELQDELAAYRRASTQAKTHYNAPTFT